MLSREEHHTLPEDYLRNQLTILLGGRAAEKLLLGTVSSGADDDIKRATELARSMVARWGMTEELGPVDLRQREDHPFLGQSMAQPREHAEQTAAAVDKAVISLLKEAEDSAHRLISRRRRAMEALVARLEEKETLAAEEIEACIGPKTASDAEAS